MHLRPRCWRNLAFIIPHSQGRAVKARLTLAITCLISSFPTMTQNVPASQCFEPNSQIIAARVNQEFELDAQHSAQQWQSVSPVSFCADWQGNNPDPDRETEVRALWSSSTLYLRFQCRYRELNVFADADPNGRRDHLWDRDVVEAFLQPDPSRPHHYKEFEVSPNGYWIDLDISPGPLADLKSGMRRSVWLDQGHHRWTAELAIPLKALTDRFDPAAVWRVNFYRVEGGKEPRFYSAWQPTHTPQPNFHVPSAFGSMGFAGTAK
jgi:alpha-galactosidase